MIKLGNVLYDGELHDHEKLEYINYNNPTKGLPTLIVGWNKTKSFFPNQDILKKSLPTFPNIATWTFSPIEDIIQYTTDLENFVKKLPEYFIGRYTYINVDPYFLDLNTLDDIENYLPKDGKLYVYKNDM